MRGVKSFDKLQGNEWRAIACVAMLIGCGVGAGDGCGSQFRGWSCEGRRVARTGARAHGLLGILGNFREARRSCLQTTPPPLTATYTQ
jgi:hypothetical protein